MYNLEVKYLCWFSFVSLISTVIVAQTFRPNVTVNSCANDKVTLTLSQMTMGGIVYIQGAGQGCRHDTVSGTNLLEFSFSTCGLVWGQPFRIVVQKKKLYQTVDDKVIPITCTVDLSHITLETVINAAPKDVEPARTVLIKPSAFMILTHGGFNISSRGITIGELVTLQIELHNQYKGSFDINANRCTASNILLISGGCATDHDVFPQFSKPRTGILQSTFKAFIPTDQLSSRRVVFSCTLDICLNSCSTPSCPSHVSRNGRRKRTEESTSFNQIHVQSSLDVSPMDDPLVEKNDPENQICLHWGPLVVCVVIFIAVLLIAIFFVVQTKRWKLKYTNLKNKIWTLKYESSCASAELLGSGFQETNDHIPSTESIESGFTSSFASTESVESSSISQGTYYLRDVHFV